MAASVREKAVDSGLRSVYQMNTILLYQHSPQERLGEYYFQKKMLTSETLERLFLDLKEHNAGVLGISKPVVRARDDFI